MKTTFFFAAGLFISATSFAQSSSNADVKTEANAQATVNTSPVTTATQKAEQGSKKAIKAVRSKEKAVEKQAKSEVKTAEKTTEQNVRETASANTEISSAISVKSNNSGKDASIKDQSAASGSTTVHLNGEKLKQDGKAIQPSVKVKPASVKVNTKIASVARIKIK